MSPQCVRCSSFESDEWSLLETECLFAVVGLFKKAAYSYRREKVKRYMKQIKELNINAWESLKKAGIKRWSRAYCPVRRYELMTSNAAESLNSRLLWARKLPICSILEFARYLLQTWFYERRSEWGQRTSEVGEKLEHKLRKAMEEGNRMKVTCVSNTIFSIKDPFHNHVVDLRLKECTCREFQLDLIPCSHAIKALSEANQSIHAYVHDYYKRTTAEKMYARCIMPVSNPRDWVVPDPIKIMNVNKPDCPKQAGRPKEKRHRSAGEFSGKRRAQKCSICKGTNHNRSTCTIHIPLPSKEDNVRACLETDHSTGKKKRGPKKCSICRATSHTRQFCDQRPTQFSDDE